MQVQSLCQAPSCEKMEPQQETKTVLTQIALNESDAQSPTEHHEKEEEPKMSVPVEPQVEVDMPQVEPNSECSSSQTQTQPSELSEMEAPKNNKRKVCVVVFLC